MSLWVSTSNVPLKSIKGGVSFPSDNLEAYYRMEDNAANTTVTNATGGTNGIASTNTSNLSISGKNNNCFQFNGSNESFTTNQTFQTVLRSSFSVAFWVQLDDGQPASGTPTMLGTFDTLDDQLNIYHRTDGTLHCTYEAQGATCNARTNTAVFANGATTWQHVAVTVTNGGLIDFTLMVLCRYLTLVMMVI